MTSLLGVDIFGKSLIVSNKIKRSNYLQQAVKGIPLYDIPIIDHHGHFGFADADGFLKEEVSDIINIMNSIGVDRAVVYSIGGQEYSILNDLTIQGISLHPDRFIGYAYIRMDSPEKAIREIERCRQAGMAGLKLHNSWERKPIISNCFKVVWEFCAEHKWPVIIHGMDLRLPRENPDTIFIHAHGIENMYQNNETVIATMRECPNYYWDTSATMTCMGAIEKAVSLFGADRLIFGSDFPLNNLATRLGAVLAARISDEDMGKILGGNIVRLLGLKMRNTFPM